MIGDLCFEKESGLIDRCLLWPLSASLADGAAVVFIGRDSKNQGEKQGRVREQSSAHDVKVSANVTEIPAPLFFCLFQTDPRPGEFGLDHTQY